MDSAPELQPLTREQLPAALELVTLAFANPLHPEDVANELGVVDDPSRFLGAFLPGHAGRQELVGVAGSFAFDMTVPGDVQPVAGVTWVGVSPLHRRQGVLRGLMRRLLDDLHAAGEPLAALFASEAGIYQRYGYGPAAPLVSLRVPRGAAFVRPVRPAALRFVEPAAAPAVLAPVYDAAAARRPGVPARTAAWWGYQLHDAEHDRDGASALRVLVHESDGAVDGYALYSAKPDWGLAGPAGEVGVREMVATDPQAYAGLWRHLLDLDLMATVSARRAAVDDPVLHLLAEPRTAQAQVRDGLWMRLVDVGPALSARRYAAPVDVVLDVQDAFCPWNSRRWRLSGDGGGGMCTPTGDPADLTLDVRDLGAAYLGTTSLSARAGAGWVQEHTPGALAATTTALGWPGPAAWCPTPF